MFILLFLTFKHVLFLFENLNFFKLLSYSFHVVFFEICHFFKVLKKVIKWSKVLLIFRFVLRTEFENNFESFFLEKTFTEISNYFLFFLDKIFKNFVLFVLFFALMLIDEIFLLIHFFDFKFLISFRKLFILINNFVKFLFLLLDVGLYVRQFVICMFFDDPF